MLSYKSRLHKNRDKNSCVFALFFFFLKLTTSAYSWPVSLFLWWSYSACMEYLSAHRSTSLTAEISASILAHPLSIVHYWCQSAICLALFLWIVCLSLIRGCTSLPICTINLIVSEYILIALHNTCPCPFFFIPSLPLLCSTSSFLSGFNHLKFSVFFFFFFFWADLVIITRLTGKDPSLAERSDPKLITMVTIFLIILQLYFPASVDSGWSKSISEEKCFPPSPTSSLKRALRWEPKMCSSDIWSGTFFLGCPFLQCCFSFWYDSLFKAY